MNFSALYFLSLNKGQIITIKENVSDSYTYGFDLQKIKICSTWLTQVCQVGSVWKNGQKKN